MKKEYRLTELIESSKIYESFEKLLDNFEEYSKTKYVTDYRYEISSNFYKINDEIENLINLLDELEKCACKWEL